MSGSAIFTPHSILSPVFEAAQQQTDNIDRSIQRRSDIIRATQARIRRNVLITEANNLRLKVIELEREIAHIADEIASFEPEFVAEIEALRQQRAQLLEEVASLRREIAMKRAEAARFIARSGLNYR